MELLTMKTLSVSKAREILSKLVSEVASEHEPVSIKGKGVSVVMMDEDDWKAIQETLYLLSVPGMRESIREGLQTPISECSGEIEHGYTG
jgi:antitoxin YefM